MNTKNAGRPREDGLRKPVTRIELERRCGKIGRRLLLMAWPLTTRGILDRLKVTAFSFSSDSRCVTVFMDIVSIDVERAYRNRSFPCSTVRIVLTENRDGSLSAESASIHLQEYQDSFDGMELMNLEEAYCRMTEYIR